MRLEETGWSMDVAEGWVVIAEPATRLTVLYRRPTLKRAYEGCVVERSLAQLGIGVVDLAVSVEEHAEAEMNRFVPDGNLERFEAVIDGRKMLGFDYTDGVSEIRSFYVEISEGAACCVTLKIGIGPSGQSDAESQIEAEEMIATIRWT